MAGLIEATEQPLIQKTVDVVVPRTVFGRVCPLGDAAFVVRPHTAGATGQRRHGCDLAGRHSERNKGRHQRSASLLPVRTAPLRTGTPSIRRCPGVTVGRQPADRSEKSLSGTISPYGDQEQTFGHIRQTLSGAPRPESDRRQMDTLCPLVPVRWYAPVPRAAALYRGHLERGADSDAQESRSLRSG